MENFTFLDGIIVSAFSIVVVFVVLYILSVILSIFSKIIDKIQIKENPAFSAQIENNDAEEKLVAQIVASCHLQKEGQSNVRIKSIVRVK